MRSRHLTNGTFLLLIGIYFLLRNLNIIEPLVWSDLINLWPLLLIILGVQLIFSRGILAILSPLLLIITFIFLVFSSSSLQEPGEFITGNLPISSLSESPTLIIDQIPVAEIDLHASRDLQSTGLSFSGNSSIIKAWKFDPENNSYLISGEEKTSSFFRIGRFKQLDPLILNLNPNLNWDFHINIPIATGKINLSNISWQNLTIESGIANLTITTGSQLHESTKIIFESGIGNLKLRIPQDLAVKIVPAEPQLLNRLNAPGFEKSGNDLITTNYNHSALKTLDIIIETGISSISIEWI